MTTRTFQLGPLISRSIDDIIEAMWEISREEPAALTLHPRDCADLGREMLGDALPYYVIVGSRPVTDAYRISAYTNRFTGTFIKVLHSATQPRGTCTVEF